MPNTFARYAWAVLAYNLAVVLWGAFVRATGSGAGCGNHWPLCNGTVTQHSPSAATIIEFTHRVSSGSTWRWWHYCSSGRFAAFRAGIRCGSAPRSRPCFLVTEALVGAALVLLQHVAKNASVSRAYSLSTHLINTLTLLACLALTAWWSTERPAPSMSPPRRRSVWMAAVSLASFVLLGVSGAIAALGDTLFPASSLAAGLAQDMDPAANIFLRLRLFHPLIAATVGAWLLFYALSSAARRPDVSGRGPGAW